MEDQPLIHGKIKEEQAFREINFLYRLSQGLTESLDIDTNIRKVISLLQEHFDYAYVQVFLVEAVTQEGMSRPRLIFRHGSEPEADQSRPTRYQVEFGEGVVGLVAQSSHPHVSNNLANEADNQPRPGFPGASAELAVPLLSGGKLIGVLDIYHQAPKEFTERDMRLMVTIAEQLANAIEKSLLYADLQTTLSQEQTARNQLVQSEKLAALGRIVASVAHELNNPLQAIQNALYLMKTEQSLSDQAREDLQVALNEADRMAELIARLREIYRPTSSADFQPRSVNDLVHEVERLLSTHLRHANIELVFIPGAHLPSCEIIPDQIRQVILNISLNAIESMPDGGRIEIETRSVSEGHNPDKIMIQFRDNGPGITREVLPYIFDPFVTTKEKGTGLGLSITYDIVQRHSGSIQVESDEGRGSTFKVVLPTTHPSPGEETNQPVILSGKLDRRRW